MSGPHQRAVAADSIFDGSIVHRHSAVLIEGERIAWIGPSRALPEHASVHELPKGCWLAPGSIDVQVNGGARDPGPIAAALPPCLWFTS